MNSKNKMIIGIILASIITVIIAILVIFMIVNSANSKKSTVFVLKDGEQVLSVDLSKVTEAETHKIGSDTEYNIVVIDKDSVYVKEATCDDKICVHQGRIYDSSLPIICIPNRLVISFS